MTHAALRVPDWRTIWLEELSLLNPLRHGSIVVLAALAALISLTATAGVATAVGQVIVPVLLLPAAAVPLRMWPTDGTWRSHHAAMPIDRGAHDLLRVGAGLVWMSVVSLVVALISVAATVFTSSPGAGLWLVTIITGPATIYLAATTVALGGHHQRLWMLAVSIAYAVLALVAIPIETVGTSVLWPLTGPLGLAWGLGIQVVGTGSETVEPALMTWLPATLLWLALAAAGVYLVAGRTPVGLKARSRERSARC